MKKHTTSTLFLVFLLSIFSCHKGESNDEEIIDVDSGKFLALIDSTKWHPVKHTATYFPKYNQLYILAEGDNNSTLWGGVDVDPGNPLKKYLLEPNGNNAFSINSYKGLCYSDNNIADAGGDFTLTKFDITGKKISGTLQFTGYNSYRTKKVKFTSTIIEDIPLKIDTGNYNGNNLSCTVQGATTSNWETKNLYAAVECMSGRDETLYIHITSITKYYIVGKELLLIIPLKNGPGKFQIYPAQPPYIYCSNNYMMSSFCSYNYDKRYLATSGELNIINIDTAKRKLNATFNIQYRDTTSKAETVQISNGTINLNTWIRMGER